MPMMREAVLPPLPTRALIVLTLLVALGPIRPGAASGQGVDRYAPLKTLPELERQIERLMILADIPVLSRPIPLERIREALGRACPEAGDRICGAVGTYLARMGGPVGVAYATGQAGVVADAGTTLPNLRGQKADSPFQAAAQAFWAPHPRLAVQAGGRVWEGTAVPDGSYLSVGGALAQVDAGFRPVWLSPLTEGAMVLSTQARALPSVGISNPRELGFLGLRYHFFWGSMSESDRIVLRDTLTTGRPNLVGTHLSIEPFPGFRLGLNRTLQFGGGDRGGDSFWQVLKAFFDPSGQDNGSPTDDPDDEVGNQLASLTARLTLPGPLPLAISAEYAGEDASYGSNGRLGNAAYQVGVHVPRLTPGWDLSYEFTEWQNAWYVHGIYLDGMRNHGVTMGHWFGEQREFETAVGGRSHALALGGDLGRSWTVQATYRTLENARYDRGYGDPGYVRGHDLTARVSRTAGSGWFGVEATLGRDVFEDRFGSLGVFVRW